MFFLFGWFEGPLSYCPLNAEKGRNRTTCFTQIEPAHHAMEESYRYILVPYQLKAEESGFI